MNFDLVCRTCLSTKSLSPIFNLEEDHHRLSAAMMDITGIKVEFNDSLPQNICLDCLTHINSSLEFRERCKEVESKFLLSLDQLNTSNIFPDETIEQETECEIKMDFDHEKSFDDIEIKTENDLSFKDNDNLIQSKSKNVIILTDKILNIAPDKDMLRWEQKSNIKLTHNILDSESDDKILHKELEKDTIFNRTWKENIKNNLKVTHNTTLDSDSDAKDQILHEELEKDTIFYRTWNENTKNNVKLDSESEIKEKTRVKCRICKKSLSIRSVDTHMSKRHPGADERKVKCELCDTYLLKIKLKRHLKMMHGQDSFVCAYCKLKLYTKESLIEHVALCADKKRKRKTRDTTGKEMSECDICHKKMQKASLKMHQKIKHAGLGPVCDHCGRKFGNKFRLNEHLRSKHGYEKYKCAECEFQSASVVAMRNHERRHRGEKPFVCDLCGARFHAAYLLSQHKQSHRTEKPLKCSLCPASFKANNSLHMHKAACHSNATYKCTLCERAYSCRNYALKHLRTVHGHSGAVAYLNLEMLNEVVDNPGIVETTT